MSESLIDRMKAATASRRVKVTVFDTTAWATPITLAGTMAASAKHPDSRALYHAETLVMHLKDEAGKPLFSIDDKPALAEEVASEMLSEAIAAINGADKEKQAKN